MYGIIEKELLDGKVKITDKERTMIDLLYWNAAVGGVKSAMRIFEKTIREKKCDVGRIIEYSLIYPRLSIRKLVGVILDSVFADEKLTSSLYKSVENTSITSARWDKRNGIINKKWKIIIQ
jgi:predicted transcriptional regulator of viral defense system